MKAEDYKDGIFSIPKKNKPKIEWEKHTELGVLAYTFNGHKTLQQVDPNDDRAYAKVAEKNGRKTYYLKICKLGREVGQLPNPKNFLFDKFSTSAKIGGIPMFDWTSVKKKVFEDYLKFLETGDQKWWRAAQSQLKM